MGGVVETGGQLKWGPQPAQYLLSWQQMATLELLANQAGSTK